jgi:hypothetical protein
LGERRAYLIDPRPNFHPSSPRDCAPRWSKIGVPFGPVDGPSEVLVTSTVKDLVAGAALAFEDRGEHELKGVPGTWRLYRVVA